MKYINEKIERIALDLTKTPSVVGSSGEIEVANKIYEYLSRIDYFKKNPENLYLSNLRQDAMNRKNVIAFIEGERNSPRTVLLLGHIDTAGIEDYGDLKKYATKPEQLKYMLAEKNFSKEIMEEIQSENWLFGRGLFDMKAGVAALIVMMEEFSKKTEELEGNIVFIAVSDEEANSGGMLSAVQELADMSEKKGWEFVAAIDTDYMTELYPGDKNKYVYIGTVGKLLPCFYIYGKETHVGQAFDGLDANLLASEIIKQINLSLDLCDVVDGEVTPPSVSLSQKDLKKEYSVQTVHAANLYFNFATHISMPGEVLEKLKKKAEKAFKNTIDRLNENYKNFCEMSNTPYTQLPWKVNVLSFEELYSRVKGEIGERLDRIIDDLAEKLLKEGVDEREFSLRVVQEVHSLYSDKEPVIIMYYAPPYYPHIYVKGETENEKQLLLAVDSAVRETKRVYDYNVLIKKFYPNISDLSYCSITKDEESISALINNMPSWPKKYRLPIKAIQKVSMPVVNIGPFGKDAHKLTERLSKAYSFDAMPMILYKTILNLLDLN